MIKSFIKKHPSSWRYISIAAILMIIFPVFFVVAYAGNVGAYIGLSAFILVGMYGLYEVFSNMNMSKLSVIYLSLLPLILFLFTNENVSPFSHFERVANSNEISNSSGAIYGSLKSLIQGSITWKNLLLLFIATLLPAVADPKIRKSGNAIRDQFIITVVTIIFSVFVKMTWLLNVFNYTWMFFFISIAIIADTFGYFGGKYLKKYIFNGAKLAPKISPKKTWAGFIIGFIFAAAFTGIVGWYLHVFQSATSQIWILIIAIIVLPVISPLGDLLFSAIKRALGIKDFSNLMPGHGGILDRVDAMSVVIFAVFLLFIF